MTKKIKIKIFCGFLLKTSFLFNCLNLGTIGIGQTEPNLTLNIEPAT